MPPMPRHSRPMPRHSRPMPRHSRPMPRLNAQESSDRAALLSPPDLSPAGADGFFVPNNGDITFNLNRPPTEKKTEGLQYQRAPYEPRKSRVSGLKKSRFSCFVSRVSCKTVGRGWRLLYRETPAGRLTLFVAYVCATDLGITGPEKRLFSPDAKHTGAEKTRLKGFSTNRHQTSHGKGRDSCFVTRAS